MIKINKAILIVLAALTSAAQAQPPVPLATAFETGSRLLSEAQKKAATMGKRPAAKEPQSSKLCHLKVTLTKKNPWEPETYSLNIRAKSIIENGRGGGRSIRYHVTDYPERFEPRLLTGGVYFVEWTPIDRENASSGSLQTRPFFQEYRNALGTEKEKELREIDAATKNRFVQFATTLYPGGSITLKGRARLSDPKISRLIVYDRTLTERASMVCPALIAEKVTPQS